MNDRDVTERLEAAVLQYHVPGIAAGIVSGDKLVAVGAAGLRKLGSEERLTILDQMHLGSCSKAMTATLIGLLVDEGKLKWDSTLESVLADDLNDVDMGFRTVTLAQLLSHRGSITPNGPLNDMGKPESTTAQRRELIHRILKTPPAFEVGSKFQYSNAGYALAAAMVEKVTGKSWEELIKTRLFEPLGMTSAGFGPPGAKDKVEQPWGHVKTLFGLGPLSPLQHDNPAWMGPAGTIHASIPDWAKFAALHLKAARGEPRLLSAESFAELHSPAKGFSYAMGWVSISRPWAKGIMLAHDGSNTLWYCSVFVIPEENVAILVATNSGDKGAQEGCAHLIRSLHDYYHEEIAPHP
jgi:CubicO group peptidase (beta-lactamase class C family)